MKINAAIPLIHHLILLAKVKFSKVKIKFQSSGLARGACRPLLGDERVETGSISSKGSKGVGAAHKKSEAPRRFDVSHKTLRLPPEQPIKSNKKDSFNRVFFIAMDLRLSVGMEQTTPEP